MFSRNPTRSRTGPDPARSAPAIAAGLVLAILLLAVGCTRVVVAPLPDGETYDYTELPPLLKARVVEGGSNPEPMTLNLTNSGACDLDFTTSVATVDGRPWLNVTPTTGLVPTAATGAPKASTALTISLDVVGPALTPGTYVGSIVIAGTCASSGEAAIGSPVRIAVNLTVTSSSATISVDESVFEIDIATLCDDWIPLGTGPAPRGHQSAVWTGREMIIWGGSTNGDITGALDSGSRYHPLNGTWSSMSLLAAPPARLSHSAVWDGVGMIVYGGTLADGLPTETGGLYDPIANAWLPTTTLDAPLLTEHAAVWTGSQMIVVGAEPTVAGGVYDPVMDAWSAMNLAGAPTPDHATAVWTGTEMIVWGNDALAPGGAYDPVLDGWRTIWGQGVLEPREGHCAVWTGREMIVWGGLVGGASAATGARYDPDRDLWTPLSAAGAPSARSGHRAVWTGRQMIVWGGLDGTGSDPGAGGVYDPVADAWTPTTADGQPAARDGHAAVWTGTQMIVWGGYEPLGAPLGSGGHYE